MRTPARGHRLLLGADGTLHVVDFGGRAEPSDGLATRAAYRSSRLHRNYDDGLLDAMHEAGFSDVTETGHRVARIMGRVTFYRASSWLFGVDARAGADPRD